MFGRLASYVHCGRRPLRGRGAQRHACITTTQETLMGKYLLAWLLGVPGIVLLLVYLFFN